MKLLHRLFTFTILLSASAFASTEAEMAFVIASRSIAVIQTDNGKLGSAVAFYDFETGTGYLTNCHVLRGAKAFTVAHRNQKASGVFIVGRPEYDLCLVGSKLKLPAATSRTFFSLRVGETVYAVGAPRGLELSLTYGIISQLRGDPLFSPPLLVQTTAPISPGSSGGGLFDSEGKLIGLTTFFFKEAQSLNFSVSVNMANGLTEYGTAKSLEDLVKQDAKALLPETPASPSPQEKIIGFEPSEPRKK